MKIKTNHNGYLTTPQIEKRFMLIRTFCATALAIIFCFLMISISSKKPITDIITFLTAPLSSPGRFCTFLIKLCPLLFTSAATCLLFSANIDNMAVESGFFAGAVASTAVATMEGFPPVIHFILAALAGGVAATLVMIVPAVLDYKFKANLLVSSLMMNYVVNNLCQYLVKGPMRDPGAGYEATAKLQDSARLVKWLQLKGGNVHLGVIIGLVAVFVTWVLLRKTKFGYKARTIGQNPNFAKLSGINVGATMLLVTLAAGIITGIGSASEVCGQYQRLNWLVSPGYGWDGIMISILAGNNPANLILAASFVAYIRTSADILNISSSVPIEIVDIAQQVVIVMIAAKGFLRALEKRVIVKNAQKQIQAEEV